MRVFEATQHGIVRELKDAVVVGTGGRVRKQRVMRLERGGWVRPLGVLIPSQI